MSNKEQLKDKWTFCLLSTYFNMSLKSHIYINFEVKILIKVFDSGRTRTCNLRCRKPTPCPLGHRAAVVSVPVTDEINRGR